MLPASASTRAIVQVDIVVNKLVGFDVFSDARRYSGMLAGSAGSMITSSPITTFTIPSAAS